MNNINSEEKRQHSSKLVPFSYYKGMMPEYFSGVPLHWHSEFEMNYMVKGCAEFICGDLKFAAGKGDIVIISPNLLHAIYPKDNSGQLFDTIVFSPEMIGFAANDRCAAECIRPIASGGFSAVHITKDHIYYDELKTTAENIFSCAKGNSSKLDMLMKSELLRLFWLLENVGDITPAASPKNQRSEFIRPAIEYINENFGENITVEKLAEILHISKSYFMNRFKQAAGVSAVEYIIQLRIKKACEFLIRTDKTVTEISFECGFKNLSNFNRQFRKIIGCTPNEYRKIG